MDETGNLTEIGSIGVRLVLETDAHLILAAEVTEIDLATDLHPLESLVGATIGKMGPNQHHQLLVLKFQILSQHISWEATVAR